MLTRRPDDVSVSGFDCILRGQRIGGPGFLLFISNATKYLANGYFVAKIILICAAGLNMIIFHGISAKDLPQWEKEPSPPLRARLAGALSILLWIAVVACGRWIGFTMQELSQ